MTCCFFFFCNGQTMDHPYCFILEFVSRLFHSVWSASTWNSGRHPGLAAFFCCRSQAWVSPIGSLGSFPTPHPTALPVNREQSALDFSRKVWQHSQAGKDDCHCHAQCRGLWFRMSGHGPEGHCWWIHVGPFPVTPLAFERRRPVALCSKKRAADWSSGLDVHDWDVDPWIIDIYIYYIDMIRDCETMKGMIKVCKRHIYLHDGNSPLFMRDRWVSHIVTHVYNCKCI